jgi:hypothetical protein
LITSEKSSLIIVMVESDSLLDTLELVAIINKNKYQDINNQLKNKYFQNKIEQRELRVCLERSSLLFVKRRK